jgi:hypothetical protein
MRFPIGARVSVDLYCFETPQLGTVVKTPATYRVNPEEGRVWVCIHFDNPRVSEFYECNDIGRGGRGFLMFSDIPGYEDFRLSMIHPAVLKSSLEATNET